LRFDGGVSGQPLRVQLRYIRVSGIAGGKMLSPGLVALLGALLFVLKLASARSRASSDRLFAIRPFLLSLANQHRRDGEKADGGEVIYVSQPALLASKHTHSFPPASANVTPASRNA
jgi:hypothetical protein